MIVDNLMNLEMLFWAGSHGGDSAWFRVAEHHALTSARSHVRNDGSTAHVALFDPATGALERTVAQYPRRVGGRADPVVAGELVAKPDVLARHVAGDAADAGVVGMAVVGLAAGEHARSARHRDVDAE